MVSWIKNYNPTSEEVEFYITTTCDKGFNRIRNDRYGSYLSSSGWRRRRAIFLVMAGGVCADCGGRANTVHHLHYETVGHELPKDVVPLCNECHAARHGIPAENQCDLRRGPVRLHG